SGGHKIAAGTVEMTGPMVLAYLSQASEDDVTGRWEDVAAAMMQAPPEPADWSSVGASDDLAVVTLLLASARGATVLELPTGPAVGGGVEGGRDPRGATPPRLGSR